jgi:hypothetical protein
MRSKLPTTRHANIDQSVPEAKIITSNLINWQIQGPQNKARSAHRAINSMNKIGFTEVAVNIVS